MTCKSKWDMVVQYDRFVQDPSKRNQQTGGHVLAGKDQKVVSGVVMRGI